MIGGMSQNSPLLMKSPLLQIVCSEGFQIYKGTKKPYSVKARLSSTPEGNRTLI